MQDLISGFGRKGHVDNGVCVDSGNNDVDDGVTMDVSQHIAGNRNNNIEAANEIENANYNNNINYENGQNDTDHDNNNSVNMNIANNINSDVNNNNNNNNDNDKVKIEDGAREDDNTAMETDTDGDASSSSSSDEDSELEAEINDIAMGNVHDDQRVDTEEDKMVTLRTRNEVIMSELPAIAPLNITLPTTAKVECIGHMSHTLDGQMILAACARDSTRCL